MKRRGFTVVELIAAVALAGLLLLTARASVEVLVASHGTLSAAAAAAAQSGTGHRILTDAVLMTQAAENGSPGFFGDTQGAVFRSRCATAGGWSEDCEVMLQVVPSVGGSAIEVKAGAGQWVQVRRARGVLGLRFLERNGADVAWRDSWGRGIDRPQAIAIIAGTDTTVYLGAAQ